jgi:hypothetical protein
MELRDLKPQYCGNGSQILTQGKWYLFVWGQNLTLSSLGDGHMYQLEL